jgi:HAD superfamily hydrolase (TIGR01509 family)
VADALVRWLLIFDFDGVIADSEVVANKVLADMVSELGVPTTLQDSYLRYMGMRFAEVMAAVETMVGRNLPEDFPDRFQARTLAAFRAELQPVNGARTYIESFSHVPRCVASSSSPDRLAVCLEVLGLGAAFGQNVFSASMVARGKPHPDIFLHAANAMGVQPSQAIVIEDSASGVQAGVAAGMRVIGLLAASHIQPGHSERLLAAGAHHVAATFDEAQQITRGLLAAE